MNRFALLGVIGLMAITRSTLASPKDEIAAAAKKLGDQPNYSWKTTVVVPDSAQFKPGPTEGKIEKDGYTWVTSQFGDNTAKTVLKGDKGAVTNQDGGWESLSDVEKEEGFGRFRALMARNLKPPAVQAANLATGAKELQKTDDAISGELTEETAKSLLAFGGRGGGAEGRNAKGSVKFWLKEGELTKYEFKVKGTVSFNGNEREVDRTTTVEIKEVGTTKVSVPEEAKKKIS